MNNDQLIHFLQNRMYLIDTTKLQNHIVFTVEDDSIEDNFKNYEICVETNSLKCSCISFQNKISVCKHIKFILEKINQIEDKRSKSCNEFGTINSTNSTNKIFYIDIKNLDLSKFRSDHNPRYREYKILQDSDYSGNCYICLEKLDKKIIRCKICNKYYHENCIYGWLRYGSACTCPNCRSQWY